MIVSPVIFTEKIACVYTFFLPSVKRGKSGSILPKNGLLGLRFYVKSETCLFLPFFAILSARSMRALIHLAFFCYFVGPLFNLVIIVVYSLLVHVCKCL